jgi:hypothetical protein
LPPLQVKHGKNTYSKGMGLNEWNIDIETKKKMVGTWKGGCLLPINHSF